MMVGIDDTLGMRTVSRAVMLTAFQRVSGHSDFFRVGRMFLNSTWF